ncbi:MAG: hypothetical protein ACI31W_01505 [Lactococcus sp.]
MLINLEIGLYQMTEGRKLKKKYLFMTLLLTALIFGLGAPKAMAATMDFTINPQIPSNYHATITWTISDSATVVN